MDFEESKVVFQKVRLCGFIEMFVLEQILMFSMYNFQLFYKNVNIFKCCDVVLKLEMDYVFI